MTGSSDTPRASARITVPADTAQLSAVRHHVLDTVRGLSADNGIADDLSLVVSELVTNTIKHSDETDVTVLIDREPDRWTVEVSGAHAGLVVDRTVVPDRSNLSGRGLFIVRSIMDTVELVERDGEVHIRCTKLTG